MGCSPSEGRCFLLLRFRISIGSIALPSIANSKTATNGHKAYWRQEQDEHTMADGFLAVLGGAGSRAARRDFIELPRPN